MKKVISVILVAAAIPALLSACGSQNKQSQKPDLMNQFTIETQEMTKEWYTKDNSTLLAEYDYSVPHMVPTADAEEAVTRAASTFNTEADKYFTGLADSFSETAQYAEDQYKYELDSGFVSKDEGWDTHYTDEASCTWNSIGKLLSVQRGYSSYAGGAHGFAYMSAWNFDVENGKFITDVTTLGEDSQKLHDAVADEILRQASEELDPDLFKSYWDDYKTTISNWNVDYYTWFTPEGMYVSFPAYSLACYAAGEQQFLISYDVIKPYLSDAGKALLGLE